MWTWLWDAKNKIENSDRQGLLIPFRKVLYSENEWELSENLEELYSDVKVNKYPGFIKHLMRDTFPKIDAWCLQRRITDKLPTANNNTNNLVESSFRYTKDIKFNRLKAFNLTEMLQIVLDNSEWYVNKVVDAANNRIASWLKNCNSRFSIKRPNIDPSLIQQLNPPEHTYIVPFEDKEDIFYVVDMDSRCCSCPLGRLTGPCKHKVLVSECKNLPSFDLIPTASAQMRQLYMFIGTGKHESLNWFLPLEDGTVDESELTSLLPKEDDGITLDVTNFEDGVEEPQNNVVTDSVPNVVDVEKILESALTKLKEKIVSRIHNDPKGYKKALTIFDKSVDKVPATVDSSIQKSLCSFGKSVTQVI